VAILQRRPIAQRAEVVAEVGNARGLDAGEDALHGSVSVGPRGARWRTDGRCGGLAQGDAAGFARAIARRCVLGPPARRVARRKDALWRAVPDPLPDRGEGARSPVTAKSSDYGRLFFQANVFRPGRLREKRARPAGTILEPARRVPLFRDCDVLVA